MHAACFNSVEQSETRIIDSDKVQVLASPENPDKLTLRFPANASTKTRLKLNRPIGASASCAV